MSEALFAALEKAFRCHIYGVKPRRNVYLVRTNRGLWVVKGYLEADKAKWVTSIARALQQHGFTRTVQYIPTAEGREVLSVGSHHYTVMNAIDGREATYASLNDVKLAAATLARFHRAARGFPRMTSLYGQVPPLIDKWEARLAQFEEIAQKINERGPANRLEHLVQSLAEEACRDGRDVLHHAFSLPLVGEMHQAVGDGTLAHRDVASHNFLLTDRGACYLIDLDTVAYDMQLVDLLQLVSRMLLLQGYSVAAFTETLEAYSGVKPLSDTQVWMIHRLLRYPDNILREVTGLYARRPGYRVRGVTQLLQLERRFRHQRRELLEMDSRMVVGRGWRRHYHVG